MADQSALHRAQGSGLIATISSTTKIAWRNLGRNRKRSMLALLSIALAQFFVLAVDGFMAGYEDALRDMMTGPLIGHVQVHEKEYRDKQSMDLALKDAAELRKTIGAVQGVTATMPRLFAPALAAKTEEGFTSLVIGIDLDAESKKGGFFDESSTNIASGEGRLKQLAPAQPQEPDAAPQAQFGAIVGHVLARRQSLEVGDQLALIGQRADGSMAADLVKIEGIAESSIELISANGILIDLSAAQEIFGMEDQVHQITVRGTDPQKAEELSAALLSEKDLHDLDILSWRKLAPELVTMMGMMSISTLIILVFVFLAAAAGIANTMLMSTFERARELGVLLALGASPSRINWMLVIETLFLGTLGLALGSVFGVALTLYLGDGGMSMAALSGGGDMSDLSFQGLNFNFRIYPRVRTIALYQGAIAMGITCFLATLWPLRFVSRLEPTEAMRR